MFFAVLTLFTALSMATVAAWFAVAGIMAVFAGAPIPALIMGCVIELGKIVGVSWVYRHWKERTSIKFFMLPAVIVAMFLTSMGIFGFLSKAHLEQNADVGNNTLQIERLDQRIGRQQAIISREQDKIDSADSVIQQLDDTIKTLIEFDKISDPKDGARAVRERQQPERDALAAEITTAQSNIDKAEDEIADLQDERLVLSQEVRELELEIGPVKYIAELVYEEPEDSFEDAVRLVIIAFIFVFDPMAILLLMGANYQFMKLNGSYLRREEDPEDEDPEDDIPPPSGDGEDLINLIDDEIDEVVEELELEPELEPQPEPEPKVEEVVESVVKRAEDPHLPSKDADLMSRLEKLAISRNLPPSTAREIWKRSDVHTRNQLLKQ